MPIFEYFCAPCQHHWEVIVSTHAADAPGCPLCGVPGHKELSAPAFQFKGTGWYVTDYAKSGAKTEPGAKSEESAKPSAEGKKADASKTDSTAATPATPNAETASPASTSTTPKPSSST